MGIDETQSSCQNGNIMKTLTELKTFDAVLRMTRFSTKRKGNEKKRRNKMACRKKVCINT